MNPRDATPAPYSSASNVLVAVPIAVVIAATRRTPRWQLAVVVCGVTVGFLLWLAATPLHAERRHDAEQRRIFYALCLYGSTPRQCAIAAGYRK